MGSINISFHMCVVIVMQIRLTVVVVVVDSIEA